MQLGKLIHDTVCFEVISFIKKNILKYSRNRSKHCYKGGGTAVTVVVSEKKRLVFFFFLHKCTGVSSTIYWSTVLQCNGTAASANSGHKICCIHKREVW